MLASYLYPDGLEAGCDEAGRGCLAGPVYAAAVILPANFSHPLLNDSKKLTALQRESLRPIIESQATAWAVAKASPTEIDEINILQASMLAMHRAITQLSISPHRLLIDGKYFVPYQALPHHCIIKGDGKYMSIAAASILAKTHRDAQMQQLHAKYPQYSWQNNKGYPTKSHRLALQQFGETPHHRQSFKLLPSL